MIIAYFIFSFPSFSCLLEFTSSVTTQNNSWYASISWKNRRTNIKVVFEWPYSGTRINGISSINDSFWRSLICSNLKSAWNKIFRWLKRLSGPKSKLQEICRATKLSSYSFRDSTYSELLFITRDDVVSQRLKFGSAFLSFSWESKIALFFNFPVSRARSEKLCDFYWLQPQITCKSGWIAQAEKRYCVCVSLRRNI